MDENYAKEILEKDLFAINDDNYIFIRSKQESNNQVMPAELIAIIYI